MRGVAYREHRFMQELRLRASKAHPPQPRMLDQEEITFGMLQSGHGELLLHKSTTLISNLSPVTRKWIRNFQHGYAYRERSFSCSKVPTVQDFKAVSQGLRACSVPTTGITHQAHHASLLIITQDSMQMIILTFRVGDISLSRQIASGSLCCKGREKGKPRSRQICEE